MWKRPCTKCLVTSRYRRPPTLIDASPQRHPAPSKVYARLWQYCGLIFQFHKDEDAGKGYWLVLWMNYSICTLGEPPQTLFGAETSL